MPQRDEAWLRHQQTRWLRPDMSTNQPVQRLPPLYCRKAVRYSVAGSRIQPSRDTYGIKVHTARLQFGTRLACQVCFSLSGAMMGDHEKFVFMIYHMPAHIGFRVRGKKRFLQERALLDDLMAGGISSKRPDRPLPDSAGECYALDDAQFDAYLAFRKRRRDEDRRS